MSGPSKNKPDVRIRFQHKELNKKGCGATGIQGGGGLGQVFYGDATCQDEGDLLIAQRMPMYIAALMLQAQKLKKEMGDKPAPALAARQWLNTKGELGLDQFKGKVVLLDFWGLMVRTVREKVAECGGVARQVQGPGFGSHRRAFGRPERQTRTLHQGTADHLPRDDRPRDNGQSVMSSMHGQPTF